MIPTFHQIAPELTLRAYPTEKFKAAMLSVSAVLPITRESACKTTLLLAVLRRGTEKYPNLAAINARLDYLFGTELSIRNYYRGDSQIIGFSADFLDTVYVPREEMLLEGILDVISQMLFHPLLDGDGLLLERYVESEKELQCESIRSLKNSPRSYATEKCRALLYRDEPCGASVVGSEEQVMSITREELTAHWKELLSNLHLDAFFVGRDEESLISALSQCLLPELKAHCKTPLAKGGLYRVFAEPKKEPLYAEDTLPVSQGQLLLGYRTGVTLTDENFYACTLLNEILGASPISKLFMNVREKQSLCYHCASSYNAYKGAILISCGLEPSNRDVAERAILAQIEALRRGEITEEELSAAKKSLENGYRQLLDSPGAMETYYYGRALLGVDSSLELCRERIRSVTREEIAALAQGLILDTVYFLRGTLEGGDGYEED